MPVQSIQKVAVIGAGTMGSQIAAHLANAGLQVLLLDVVPMEAFDRNCRAKEAMQRLAGMQPSPYMHPQNANLITIGNTEDDLSKIKEADWIIEALLEDQSVKAEYYRRINAHRKVGSIVSSSSAALTIQSLINGQSQSFMRDFLITRFLNPPRTCRFMELIASPDTRADVVEFIADFCDRRLGKTVSFKREGVSIEDEPLMVKQPIGFLFLSDLKKNQEPIISNASASLWDCDDGVYCLEFTTKMNVLDRGTFAVLEQTLAIVEALPNAKGLVLYSDHEHFSVGADLNVTLDAIRKKDWDGYQDFVRAGQKTFCALRFAPFPTVAAVSGYAVGGGCELALHASSIQAYAESFIGLVEVSLGVIPALGGCAQMLARASRLQNSEEVMPISRIFESIGRSKISGSAMEARDMHYLAPGDGITMNRDRLLYDAKQRVLDLAKEYRAPEPQVIKFAGAAGRSVFNLVLEGWQTSKALSETEYAACQTLVDLFCGDKPNETVLEFDVMAVECAKGMLLLQRPDVAERIERVLKKGAKAKAENRAAKE